MRASPGNSSVVADVAQLLGNGDAQVRSRAVIVIGLAGTAADTSHIIPLLDDDEAFVRRDACVALGTLGGIDSIAPLAGKLSDEEEDSMVRASAARALGMANDTASVSIPVQGPG